MPLKYLSSSWRSLEMPLIKCKVKLELKPTKHCALAAAGNDNINYNPNNIILLGKTQKLYGPTDTLSAKDNKKLSKLHSKGFERSVCWNEYKTKGENKNSTN